MCLSIFNQPRHTTDLWSVLATLEVKGLNNHNHLHNDSKQTYICHCVFFYLRKTVQYVSKQTGKRIFFLDFHNVELTDSHIICFCFFNFVVTNQVTTFSVWTMLCYSWFLESTDDKEYDLILNISIHWGLVMPLTITDLGQQRIQSCFVTCLAPSHYLNQF